MAKLDEYLSTKLAPVTTYDDFVLTKSSGLIGGLELGGITPNVMDDIGRTTISRLGRSIVHMLQDKAIIHQYYIHLEGKQTSLSHRNDSLCDTLSKRRVDFLNKNGLAQSKLLYLVESTTDQELNELKGQEVLKHLGEMLYSKVSRSFLKKRFSMTDALWFAEEELNRQSNFLDDNLKQIGDRLGMFMHDSVRKLSRQDFWALNRFLTNLNPELLNNCLSEPIPANDWDLVLGQSDIQPVKTTSGTVLKFDGPTPVYAKIATIIGSGDKHVIEGAWATGNYPTLQRGNYIIMNRYTPLTRIQCSKLITKKENELHRQSFSFLEAMTSSADQSDALFSNADKKDSIKGLLKELDEAENSKDQYGYYCSYVIVFDECKDKLKDVCRKINSSLISAGFKLIWESAGIQDAYENALFGNSYRFLREQEYTSSQYGACNILFKTKEGQKNWEIGGFKEECQYIFTNEDGSPFYFSPYVGGKCMIFGVGPIRSGKTFTKNTLATHFAKFGGYYSAIDIDPGTEPVAEVFGSRGAIFNSVKGFNPFSVAKGENDQKFKEHLLRQMALMVTINEAKDLKELTSKDQKDIERAIGTIFRQNKGNYQQTNFLNFLAHLGGATQDKFSLFNKGGIYQEIFGSATDSIGSNATNFSVYNLLELKGSKVLPIVMNEIFYRVISLFESPDMLKLPKFLDIDEAHFLLGIEGMPKLLETLVRTWGKYFGGMALWSQSPKEFSDVNGWPALRSAATTFFFFADPEMRREDYIETFRLTNAECDAIETLIPKKQAFIVQRELGVAQKVNLVVEPEQYVINTSIATERSIRSEMFARYKDDVAGKGIQETMKALGLK